MEQRVRTPNSRRSNVIDQIECSGDTRPTRSLLVRGIEPLLVNMKELFRIILATVVTILFSMLILHAVECKLAQFADMKLCGMAGANTRPKAVL